MKEVRKRLEEQNRRNLWVERVQALIANLHPMMLGRRSEGAEAQGLAGIGRAE